MAIDLSGVVQAVIEAATQGRTPDRKAKAPNPHLSGGGALLLGVGLVTVGRLAVPKGREMILGSLQRRLVDAESQPEDENFDEEDEYDEELEGEGDEDFDEEDEYDEEPGADSAGDFDEEEDEDERRGPRMQSRTRARSRS